jgi:hypothetical protein
MKVGNISGKRLLLSQLLREQAELLKVRRAMWHIPFTSCPSYIFPGVSSISRAVIQFPFQEISNPHTLQKSESIVRLTTFLLHSQHSPFVKYPRSSRYLRHVYKQWSCQPGLKCQYSSVCQSLLYFIHFKYSSVEKYTVFIAQHRRQLTWLLPHGQMKSWPSMKLEA